MLVAFSIQIFSTVEFLCQTVFQFHRERPFSRIEKKEKKKKIILPSRYELVFLLVVADVDSFHLGYGTKSIRHLWEIERKMKNFHDFSNSQ